MKKEYNLIKYKDVDQESLGPEVEFYLSIMTNKKAYKIFGTNEKGIIILVPSYNGYVVQYAFVRKKFRLQGVCRALLDSACVYCKRYHWILEVRIIFNSPFADALERYALERKMIVSSIQRLSILQRVKFDGDEGKGWINGRLLRVSQRFLSKGYCVSSFEKAPKDILEKLRIYFKEKIIPGWETPRDMNPFNHRMDTTLSFICWKDNEPVSYICIVRYGDSVVAKEHFCFRKYFSTGISIVPLGYFANAIQKDPSVRKISFMTLESNMQAIRMLNRQYSKFDPKDTLQKEYVWNGKPICNN